MMGFCCWVRSKDLMYLIFLVLILIMAYSGDWLDPNKAVAGSRFQCGSSARVIQTVKNVLIIPSVSNAQGKV